ISHDRPTAKTTLSLDEVLDFCRGRLAVNVELKCEKDETRARETGASVATRLAARGRADVYVSSFWWSALEGARTAAPAVRRPFVYSDAPDRAGLFASAKALALWALHPNRAYVTQELVRAAHAAARRVNAGTVNDAAGNTEQIGLALHQEASGGATTTRAQHVDGLTGRGHRRDEVARLVGDALERRARQVRARRAALDPDEQTAGVHVPVRRAEAGEG